MLKTLLLVYRILKWHKKTFPEYTICQQEEKLFVEAREAFDALEDITKAKSKHRQEICAKHIQEEIADMIIAGINLLRFKESRQDVIAKMNINEKRNWKNGQHMENNNGR
ncbi:MAG: hypothetical protein J1F17_01655 [Oscillospiraceae bacterium]|nr:hypothetical protein [Oscillospiraceae bacterium]